MRRLSAFLLSGILLVLASCSDSKKSFTVIGEFQGMPEQQVVLEEVGLQEITVVDSVQSKDNGTFELDGTAPEPGLYRVRFEQQPETFVLLSVDKGNVKVTGNWAQLADYQVAGSPSSSSLHAYLAAIRSHMRDVNTLGIVIDTLQAQGKDSLLTEATADLQKRNEDFTLYIEKYADTTKYLPNAIFAATMLNPESEKQFLGAFTQNLDTRFSASAKLTKDFKNRYSRITADQTVAQEYGGPAVGSEAPAISLPTPQGATVSLASLKGKYVLVDFWASWCGPCRGENPNVVAAYKQFSGKNFTILGVSLDQDKAKWQEAIKADGLTWTHISDLQGWESIAARDYKIESIPANFLIGPDGKIIARDLRGPALAAKLAEVLK